MKTQPTTLWVNGRFVYEDEPVICATDGGVLWGWGAFETLRLCDGLPVHCERHLKRLTDTMLALHMPRHEWVDALPDVTQQLSVTLSLPNSVARWTVTVGNRHEPTVICHVKPLPSDLSVRMQGLAGISVRIVRPLAEFKSTSYLSCLVPTWGADADAAGRPIERIFVDGTEVLEGARTNIIILINREICTPPADGRILSGVMRGVCLEQAAQSGFVVKEIPLTADMLHSASACYLTNSVMGVVPLLTLDGVELNTAPWIGRELVKK